MKRLICLLLLPLFSLIFLCGCGDDKTSKDLATLYESMVNSVIVDKENKLFGDSTNPNSINIVYTLDINNAINNVTPTTDIQKRFTAVRYQQKLLDYIYNYYENNNEKFYAVMSTAEFSNNDMNDLYAALESLKTRVNDFKLSYDAFVDSTESGISDVMEFNLTNYAYELNRLIESSFDFMYKFANIYETYGIEDYSKKTIENIQIKVDKAYLDIAYVIYLENFKAFDYSVGSKGICDLLPIIDNSDYVLIDDLNTTKNVSLLVQSNLKESDTHYAEVNDLLNNFLYANEVFNQRFKNYQVIYNEQDIYTISQYKFNLMNGISYESYIKSLSNSDRSSVTMLDNFVDNTYQKLVDKLSLIVE